MSKSAFFTHVATILYTLLNSTNCTLANSFLKCIVEDNFVHLASGLSVAIAKMFTLPR